MRNETKKQMSIGIVLSYAVIVVQFMTGLLYTPIVLKTLGQSQYGVYSLCTSFVGYLTIMNSGANAAYIRFYVQTQEKDSTKIASLNGLFLKIFSVLSLLALFGGWIIAAFSPLIFGNKISGQEYNLVKICFILLAFTSAFQVLNCVFSSLVIANERFVFSKLMNLLVALLNPILTIPFLFAGYDCVIIIVIHLFTMVVTVIVNAFYCFFRLNTKFDLKTRDSILLFSIVQFAGFIVLQSLMDQVNWQIDKFILARTHGTEEISLYSVGATFNRYYITFSAALSSVFIAQVNRLQANDDNKRLNELFIKSSRVFAYCIWLFISLYIFIGKQFVSRWAGDEYIMSYYIGLLLMLPVTASLTMGLAQDIARAMNKHQMQIIINFIICIINGMVSIPLAMHWGAMGSAIGTFFAEICMCIIAEPIYYKKMLGLNMGRLLQQVGMIVPGLIIPALVAGIAWKFELVKEDYLNIVLWSCIYIVAYVTSMWFLVFNEFEKKTIRGIIYKIYRGKNNSL